VTLSVESQPPIAWLRLDRPQALNALDTELTAALEGAVERVAAMTDVTVLVIAGRGRAFCAGNDITEMATLSAEQPRRSRAARPR